MYNMRDLTDAEVMDQMFVVDRMQTMMAGKSMALKADVDRYSDELHQEHQRRSMAKYRQIMDDITANSSRD